jgi:hypothetical protein
MKLLMEQWRKYLSEDGTTDSGRRNGHSSRDTRSEICFDGYANSTDPESGTQGRLAEEEEEEERSELEKIQQIFVSSGTQAVELGEMVIPDEPEVRDMRKLVESTREFLKLFENPAMTYQERQKQRDPWNKEATLLINEIYANSGRKGLEGPGGSLINMMFELGQAYINLEGIIGFGKLSMWRHKIDDVAEWAGAPMPKIPEEWSSK